MDEAPSGYSPVRGLLAPVEEYLPGGGFAYGRDQLYSCDTCGALVSEDRVEVHDTWHVSLQAGLDANRPVHT